MNPFMKQNSVNKGQNNTQIFVDFSKASPEAIDQILSALNAEVDAAVAQKRIPTIDGAWNRMTLTPSIMI